MIYQWKGQRRITGEMIVRIMGRDMMVSVERRW